MVNIIALVIFLITYLLIALRGLKFLSLPPWVSLGIGAVLMVIFGIVKPDDALQSIDLNVILFLLSLFTIASAMEVSGGLDYLAYLILTRIKKKQYLPLAILFSSALLSAGITNDGVAASWTPIVLRVGKISNYNVKTLMYSLAYGITIGSVMLPTGNPQNLLIALQSGIKQPFTEFSEYLLLSTLLNLILTFFLLRFLMGNERGEIVVRFIKEEVIKDKFTFFISLLSFLSLIPMFFLQEILSLPINPVFISLTLATLNYAFSSKRRDIIRNLDWSTIMLFIFLFILTRGIINGQVLQIISNLIPLPNTIVGVFISAIFLSQIMSNVPMVSIYIPIMLQLHVSNNIWIALAASSTIAGNLTLLGAASNLIISESSEIRGGEPLRFFEFLKYGSVVTLLNSLIYFVFLDLNIKI